MIEKCKADFVDTASTTCKVYVVLKLCTPNGDYGDNWIDAWGEFVDFAKDGYDARNCPGCGCIGTKTNNYSEV